MRELIQPTEQLLIKIQSACQILDIDGKIIKAKALAQVMSQPDFWRDQVRAATISKQAANFAFEIKEWQELRRGVEDILFLAKQSDQEKDDSIKVDLERKLVDLENKFNHLEFSLMFSGEYDGSDAIMAIHAGAGGTDAQDWAEMLLRMYSRYAESKKWTINILDKSIGQEAGVKSAVIQIKGRYAYGYLKSEAGVHRLVRISPFDAEKMRHTSFALVEVLPVLEEVGEINLKDDDLRIDVFRASGHGGQSVNTTDSAVRIKHLPTGITVACQNERSQHQNKETAMKILKSKLHQYYQTELEEEKQKLRGEFSEAAWGNQARSYVLHPYKLVKDHRTGFEMSEADKVLDGQLDELVESYLKK